MTHEYVIAVGGRVEPAPADRPASAVGWAADAVLAVGGDAEVRAISRGDSSFLDIRGVTVTALPRDIEQARMVVAGRPVGSGVGAALLRAGLLGADAVLAAGSAADLAFWSGSDLVAVVRGGVFTEGDARCGPFPRAS